MREEEKEEQEWKLERIWAQGGEEAPKYKLKQKGSTRTYYVETKQMPKVLIDEMAKGAIEVYFKGEWEGLGQGHIVGPVVVLEGKKW